jgi:hypothetical protein
VGRGPVSGLYVRTSNYIKASGGNGSGLNALHDNQKLNFSQIVNEKEAGLRGKNHVHLGQTPPKLLRRSSTEGVVSKQLISQAEDAYWRGAGCGFLKS